MTAAQQASGAATAQQQDLNGMNQQIPQMSEAWSG
jgi:hypothetical protein